VTWTDNPRTDVTQYKIWRTPKNQPTSLIATVSRGVQQWTDPSYTVTGTSSDNLLFYDIYAVWSVTGALSDAANAVTAATQSGLDPRLAGDAPKLLQHGESNVPSQFAITSYPNPFNPTTTLRYSLPEDARVTLAIYDVMGREIARLVDAERSAGRYSVFWTGTDRENKSVPSGVYIYRLLAGRGTGSEAVVLSGKLLLTK
jgi:hypothetical protein